MHKSNLGRRSFAAAIAIAAGKANSKYQTKRDGKYLSHDIRVFSKEKGEIASTPVLL